MKGFSPSQEGILGFRPTQAAPDSPSPSKAGDVTLGGEPRAGYGWVKFLSRGGRRPGERSFLARSFRKGR